MKLKNTAQFLKNHLLTIITLTVSLFTLLMYVRQTNLLTKQTDILIQQNKATTWPHLYVGRSVSFDRGNTDGIPNMCNILIINQGNGPAIIEKVVMRLDGNEVERWNDFYKLAKVPSDINCFQNNSPLRNRVIKPAETIELISWYDHPQLIKYIYPKLKDLELEICYRSVLNEYWTIKRSSFEGESYYDDNVITYQEGCQLKAEKYFKE